MPRMGDLADLTQEGMLYGPPPEPVLRREEMPRYIQQAADAPYGYEPNMGMWPTPRLPAPPVEPQERSYMPFSNWRASPPKRTAGVVMGELASPGGPLDVSMMVPGPGWLRTGAMALGGTLESDEAQAAKKIKMKTAVGRGPLPKGAKMGDILAAETEGEMFSPAALANPRLRAQADAVRGTYPQYAEQYPEVGPPALMQKLPDPKAPGKYLMKPGPEVPYSSMEEALAMDARPDHFLSKKKLPQVEEFADARAIIQKDLDLHGYEPYFDPAKRFDVKGEHYGPFADTGTAAAPATAKTDAEWFAKYGTPENRAKLQTGYAEGKTVPDSANWYFMGQLEKEYIKELGPKAGRDAFKREFGDMMAATTGGADPYNNFLMAQYANVAAKKGERLATRAYELPFPIGGRYASGNLEQAQKYIDAGMKGFDPAQNPKRYDFSSAFAGNKNASTIDEQMYGALRPPTTKPSVGLPEWYGPATRVAREEAAKAGVDARGFQDIAWAGLKKGKTGEGFDYAGPMINTINRSVETTHQLTGMPRAEIVRRGLVLKEIPMYGIGGVAAMGALARQDKREDY